MEPYRAVGRAVFCGGKLICVAEFEDNEPDSYDAALGNAELIARSLNYMTVEHEQDQ